MPELCYVPNCNLPGDDEYTYMDEDEQQGFAYQVTWKLCAGHCEFAIEVVECISNLEAEVEKWSMR